MNDRDEQLTKDRDEQLMSLAAEALRISAAQRDSFLREKCHEDEDLYAEASEIVEWEVRMGHFMRNPLIDLIRQEKLDRPFQPKQVIADRFEIIREIGDGGMGVVYEAYDSKREQRIAIKCAKLGYELLPLELKGAQKIRHKNVCQVYEIHTAATELGKLDFLTMEFLDGETLLKRLSRGKLDMEEAWPLALQLCEGLAEAHLSGVTHGDLKPANIILSTGKNNQLRAVITDFGLATDADGNTDLLGGTPSYMAPELKQDIRTSSAADVYALGVILYEIVTGQKPFPKVESDGPTPAPAAPGKLIKDLPGKWDKAILPCLAERPEKRPSVEQVLSVLESKPFYLQAWFRVAALAFFMVALVAWFVVVPLFKPSDTRLAMLPVEAPEDLARLGNGILRDVSERVTRLQRKSSTISVMPPSDVTKQGGSLVHATHTLQLKFFHQGQDIVVEQTLTELAHHTEVARVSNHYSPQMIGDIPSAITGTLSSALHLSRPKGADTISPAATAAYDRGLAFMAQDYYSADEAMASFQEAATEDPHSTLPLAGLAEAQLRKFDATKDKEWQEKAQQSLEKAEALNPDSVRVLLLAGHNSLVHGKYSIAMDYYNRILETDPRNIEALIYKGFTLDRDGKTEDGIHSFRQAISVDPQRYLTYEDFGTFYYNDGKYQEAAEQYRKSIEFAPGRPSAYANLAAALLNQQQYEEAKEVLEASLKIKETPQAFNNLGAIYAFLRQDDLAAKNYQRALKQNPGYIPYWLNLGDAERRLGNSAGAKSAYEQGKNLARQQLTVNPEQGQARAYLAYSLMRLGDRTGAADNAAWAISSWPNDNDVVVFDVLTYAGLGDKSQALNIMELGTAEAAKRLNAHPDLADLRKDLRFKQLLDKKTK